MAQQLADVGDAVFDHGRPLQTQPEAVYPHVRGQPHCGQHLRSEHPAVTDFNELLEALMVAEDLHARFGIGVVAVVYALVVTLLGKNLPVRGKSSSNMGNANTKGRSEDLRRLELEAVGQLS